MLHLDENAFPFSFNFWELSPTIVIIWKMTINYYWISSLFSFFVPLLPFAGPDER
jgi:hypothetical protein